MSSYSYYNGPNQSQFQQLSVPLQGSYSVDPKTTSVAKQQYSSNLDINSGTMDYMAPKTEFNEIYYSQVPQEKYSYSPNKVLGASNNQSPSPYFSQKLQPYNITQLHETEFEQILAGKQNEIEYWKQKNIKLQKQLDESENKVNYLSNEYDKLRVQHLSLQESQESSKQSLYLEIQTKESMLQNLQEQYNSLNEMYVKRSSEQVAISNEKLELEMKVNDLQRQVQDYQLKVQNIDQDEVIKRAARPIFENKQSGSSSRVVVVDNHLHSSQKESEVIKAQFEMIDRQNSLIEYQKQQIIEKDQRIGSLQQQLWDQQEMINSSKGRSVFC